ncbi:hypothetical protein [Actinocorallia libanotica]|uniref:Peptidase n=1 Tax=Actinocorallia libanotica TaxID=46162 RepID=A0ABP4CGA9_9ACTN
MLHVRRSVVALLACAALAATAGTSAAQAAPRSEDALTASVTRNTNAADRQRILDYWTPERRRNARVPVLTRNASGTVTRTLRSQEDAADPPGGNIQLPDSPIAGKLFYFNPESGEDETCSGTVVDAPSESLVMTAAHCLKAGGENGTANGAWYEDIVFVPGYGSGGLENAFVWYYMKVAQRWSTWSDTARDVGSVVVEKLNGSTLEAHTGNGATFVWNQGVNTPRTIVTQAYPQNVSNGQFQVSCQATTENAQPQWDHVGIAVPGCWLNQGASGSGWILDWGTGSKKILGLTSSLDISDGSNYSPYFDSNTNVQYTTASTVMPPA